MIGSDEKMSAAANLADLLQEEVSQFRCNKPCAATKV